MTTTLTADETLARLEAAGVTAQLWSGGHVTRIYLKSTPQRTARSDYGYVTPGVEWRAALAHVSNKIRHEIKEIILA